VAYRRTPPAQPLRHIGGGLALAVLIFQVGESDADGLDLLVYRIPSVPALIPPLLVFGVRGGPVYFDARPVVLIQVVQVPAAATLLPDSDLPFRRWQAVRAFHALDIAQLKRGESAFTGIAKRHLDLTPPAHPRAGVHRLADPLRGGAPAPDRAADPVIGFIEAP